MKVNRILIERGAAAENQLGAAGVSEVHVIKDERDIVSDIFVGFFSQNKRIAINMAVLQGV